MKKIILFLLICSSACSQEESREQFITSFINEVIIKNDVDFRDWVKYIEIVKTENQEEKDAITSILTEKIKELHFVLSENDNQFQIIKHNELSKFDLVSNLRYENLSNVYYIISNDTIIAPVIVENKKITAFFFGITKHKDKSYPWLLNNKE